MTKISISHKISIPKISIGCLVYGADESFFCSLQDSATATSQWSLAESVTRKAPSGMTTEIHSWLVVHPKSWPRGPDVFPLMVELLRLKFELLKSQWIFFFQILGILNTYVIYTYIYIYILNYIFVGSTNQGSHGAIHFCTLFVIIPAVVSLEDGVATWSPPGHRMSQDVTGDSPFTAMIQANTMHRFDSYDEPKMDHRYL